MTRTDRRRRRSLRPKHWHWSLHLACNDWRSGMFTGNVHAIEIGLGRGNFRFGTDFLDEWHLKLDGPEVRMRILKDEGGAMRLHVSHYEFKVRGYTEWFGNWCWDACYIQRATVRELCRHLKARRWSPEDGSQRMWEWFERLEPKR